MTHLHSDHISGMSAFGGKQILVSVAAANGHAGALMCRIPQDVQITPLAYKQGAVGVFPSTAALTEDGAISVVPTPGHSIGHQSVLIQDERKSVCIVGDAAFSLAQIQNEEIGGIVENHADAANSADLLKQQLEMIGTIMLPTHDPSNAHRLRQLQ